MSCRVLERGVERTLMQSLFEAARLEGVERVTGEYIPSERNRLVQHFFEQFGFKVTLIAGAHGPTRNYELPVSDYQSEPTQIELVKLLS